MIFDRAEDILMLITMQQKKMKKLRVLYKIQFRAEIRFVGHILNVRHDFLKIFEKFGNFQ